MLSLRTKFRTVLPRIVTDGTFSIITVGLNTARTTNKYTYAGDVVTSSASFLTGGGVAGGGACSNSELGLFFKAGGQDNTVGATYRFANDVTTNYLMNVDSSQAAGTGNDVKGLVIRGQHNQFDPPSVDTAVFSYATQVMTSGGNLTIGARAPGACGNKEMAYIAVGGEVASVNSNKYQYATDSAVGGTAFQVTMLGGAATSNENRGIFRTRSNALTTQQYVFANDTTASATSMLANGASSNNAASGSSSTGIFGPTAQNPVNKYEYATDVVTEGATLLISSSWQSVSNGTKGVTM